MQQTIQDVHLHLTTRERYLNYALSVITARALPDVRDGLKPVQRRILYAMYHNLHLTADSKHKKSAAVVGEVMAKYHPHGDQSIYDALVRMAQDFSLRYPLVDGQGNFGSLDGDRAAAMRYTETKLRHLAGELLSELKKQTVDFRANYDGTLFEPITLPAQVPNLLINGASGIAVGMATNIPPHNLREVVGSLIALITDPELSLEQIVKEHVLGPDFPTGGELLTSPEDMLEMYRTGRGPVEVRGEYQLESEGRARRVVITSIPYGVNKSNLVAEIADHIRDGKLPQIVDVRDESTDEIRIVLDMKRSADPEAAMAYLYKRTSLQNRFNVNLTALCPTDNPEVCQPQRLGLKEVLVAFLDFRYEVTRRRLEYDLAQLEKRIHLLMAFAILFNALDEAIKLIRESDGKADARSRLMERFDFDHDQAEAILETKLYRLAKLEINAIRAELAEKQEAAADIRTTLASDRLLKDLVRSELENIVDAYGDNRRTKVVGPVEQREYTAEHYLVAEETFVIVTRQGRIKRQKSYSDVSTIRVKDDDQVGWLMPASTLESLILLTDRGKAYTVRIADLTQTTGYGEPVQTRFDFSDGEHIVGAICTDPRCLPEHIERVEEAEEVPEGPTQGSLIDLSPSPITVPAFGPGEVEALVAAEPVSEQTAQPEEPPADGGEAEAAADPTAEAGSESGEGETVRELPPGPYGVAFSKGGKCLRFSLESYREASNRNGRIFMRLDRKMAIDGVVGVVMSDNTETVSLASRNGHYLLFDVGEIKVLSGAGKGVMAIKLKRNDFVLGFCLTKDKMDGLHVETSRGREEVLRPNKYRITRRGGKGRELIRVGYFAKALTKPQIIELPKAEEIEVLELTPPTEEELVALEALRKAEEAEENAGEGSELLDVDRSEDSEQTGETDKDQGHLFEKE